MKSICSLGVSNWMSLINNYSVVAKSREHLQYFSLVARISSWLSSAQFALWLRLMKCHPILLSAGQTEKVSVGQAKKLCAMGIAPVVAGYEWLIDRRRRGHLAALRKFAKAREEGSLHFADSAGPRPDAKFSVNLLLSMRFPVCF